MAGFLFFRRDYIVFNTANHAVTLLSREQNSSKVIKSKLTISVAVDSAEFVER